MSNTSKKRVSIAFGTLPFAMLIAFSRNVISLMTLNPHFVAPFPALVDVTTAIDNLDARYQLAMDGGRQAMIVRNVARAELLALMRQLAAYVESHSQNDLEVINSSGFYATKTPAPLGPLPAPQVPVLRNGAVTGSLGARTRKVNGAYAYNWRVALASAPTVYVQTAQTTAARSTFYGLAAGQTYGVEVNALGTVGPSDWTPITNKMVV